MSVSIVLDISRLLWRAKYSTPTGIDRVEMAYAQHLLHTVPERVAFAAITPFGLSGRLPTRVVEDFLADTALGWSGTKRPTGSQARSLALRLWAYACANGLKRRATPRPPTPRAYLMLSHTPLQRMRVVQQALAREHARLVCFVHDLIPLEYPEFARPDDAAKHTLRMDTVARHAELVLVNSDSTRDALEGWMDVWRAQEVGGRASQGRPRVALAPLGISVTVPITACGDETHHESPAPAPYFLMIGTMEPRKNHLFMLQLWRRMMDEPGGAPPLLLVGRRGWENENLIDMLDRCVQLRDVVSVHETLSDAELVQLTRGARALLLPSFAEGYGLPLAEALAMGVPALCSDIAALREVGRDVPEYFDPQDGPAWRGAVRDYAKPGSMRRAAQIERLRNWRAPTWAEHFNTVMPLIDEVCV
jgi:glycosyltransferase involved in cell wall biosynthesis